MTAQMTFPFSRKQQIEIPKHCVVLLSDKQAYYWIIYYTKSHATGVFVIHKKNGTKNDDGDQILQPA